MASLFETMARGAASFEAKSIIDADALTWGAMFGSPNSKSGVAVNIDSALRVTTVLACVRVLAEGVAQLPLQLGRIDPETDAFGLAKDQRLYNLLYRRPNDWMTSFELRETLMIHAALTGNGLAVKNVLGGEVVELLPVPWNCVQPQRLPNYGLVFHVNDPFGLVGTFRQKDVLHIRGPSWDTLLGMQAVQEAREAIGLAISTEEAHARLHANGARPGGLFTVDGSLSKDARDRIKEAMSNYTGSGMYKSLVLDKGAAWTSMSMTGVDAQHLETRRFQIEEICRVFRVFPHMVGYSDKTATFASAESFFQGHVLHTLMPWLERWEQSLERDVLPRGEDLAVRFDVRQLIRGDTAARASFYATGISAGWLTRNDARRMESLPALPGLDEPLAPLNMGSTGAALAAAEGPATAKAVRLVVDNTMRNWVTKFGGLPSTDDQSDELQALLTVRIDRVLQAAA